VGSAAAYVLDHDPHVAAWVKDDHLGFEIAYLFNGVRRKYRPDFLVRLTSGATLVVEVKGQDDQENQKKRIP
jgi:type III restriction enzyme